MNKYEKRWENAVNVATKLNELFDQGYLIFMEDNDIMTHRFDIRENAESDSDFDNGIFLQVSDSCNIMYFLKDMELDNGYYTPIKEYNKTFNKWRAIPPEKILNLKF